MMFDWVKRIIEEQGTATFPVVEESQGFVRMGPDGTPDPEGEFYICEPCNAVVSLEHECRKPSG